MLKVTVEGGREVMGQLNLEGLQGLWSMGAAERDRG